MKRTTLHMNKSNWPRCFQRLMTIPMALALLLSLFSEQYIADAFAACATPKDDPNPNCGNNGTPSGGCWKVELSPTPQSCTGPNINNLVCFQYYVSGTLTQYTHSGTACGCDTGGWGQDGPTQQGQVLQAYNNDTSCGG